MYDGEGHTIKTNELVAAFRAAMGGGFTVQYAVGEIGGIVDPALTTAWTTVAPVYTNVGEYVVWYKVTSPNYNDFVHAAKVTITEAYKPLVIRCEWMEGVVAPVSMGFKVKAHGVECQTVTVTAADGWKKSVDVKVYEGGQLIAYSLEPVQTSGVRSEIESYGCKRFGSCRFADLGLTRNGWKSFGSATLSTEIYTVDGWRPVGEVKLNSVVVSQDRVGGEFFLVKNYKATFDIDDGTGGEGGKASSFSYAGVYDGLGHGIDVQIANPPAGTTIRYSRGSLGTIPMSGWSTVNPLFTNVCDKVVVWYAVECAGYISYTNNATVTITSKPIAVSADAKEKVFGTSDPALTYVASGLLGMDTLTGALTRAPGEAVGTYAILKGTLAAGLNYALDFTGATFTISQTPIIGPFEPAEPDIDPETGLVSIRILGDQGPIEIPDNLGPFILDLNGHSITGVCGSAEVGTYDGGPALTIVHVDGGEGTGLIIRNSDPEGRGGIFGGDGANGTAAHPAGGNGGPGILIEDAAVAPSVTVEENVLVRGGRGGDGYAGSGADGGNGGAGIEDRTTEPDDSTIVNGGTIEGGDGGNGADGTGDTPGGNGGNGGAGVDGDVDVNTGTITGGDGGDGGDSESGNGGNGGDGGDGVGGDVADNTGTITGGNGGNGGDSESGNGGNGGDGGDGVGGDVGSNEGTITGGNGSNGGDSESGNGGNGGDGGDGVGGDVGDNTGTITDGEAGTTVLTATMVSLDGEPWIYMGRPIEPTVAVTSGRAVLVEGVDFTVAYQNNVNAGTATVVVTGKGNYTGICTEAFEILPRPVTVTSKDISKPYDGMPLALTASDIELSCGGKGLPADESFVYGDFAERTEVGQTSATFTIAAGAGTDLANYAITPVYGTITLAKSATEIGVTAKSGSWIYDGAAHSNRTYTATNLSTLQAGDALEVSFDEASVVTTPVDGPERNGVVANVITSVRVIRNGADDVTANYTLAWYPGTLMVTKRPVTVTVVGHVATNTYDAVEHAVSGYDSTTEDELYDIAADTTFAGTASAKGTDAGSYAMNLAADQFANGNENFDVTYAVTDGALVVEAADMTDADETDFVLALGPNPVYNGTVQTIPVTAVSYKGLPVTYTLAGENATHAGTYTLTVKANGNFAGEKSTTWQILKRRVTLTSGSSARVYDATPLRNAAVSVSGDGFIGLEGATYAVTGAQTDVGSSRNAFTYTLKAGTLAGDYEIATAQGDLVVTPRAVTLLSASASKVYDAAPLVKDAVTVKPGSPGFAGSEGFAAACSGTITAVGTTPNVFTYTLVDGAKAGNYAITTEYGTLTVTRATLDPGTLFPGLATATEEEGILCERVYNGKAQPFEVEISADFTEEYEFLYAVTPSAWTDVAPTRRDVSEGSLKVYFRFLSPNFEPCEGFGTLRVVPKEITDEMVQPGEDAFYWDGADKKPTVDVIHEVDGQDICTPDDYTFVYGEKVDAGWWVTVTGKGNYSGTVTTIVPVKKRLIDPEKIVVTPKTYNGKKQTPSVSMIYVQTKDERGDMISIPAYEVISNPGGIDVGEYTNVVLRLTDPTDYMWKGSPEDQTDITLVFAVTKANNGWSRYPAMAGWEYGQTPSEPNLGQARYGTVQIAYRKAGADVSTETAARPVLPGLYIARFYVEATDNFIGVTRDVAFEIAGTAPDDPVDPPPELPDEVTALISMGADGTPVIGWTPDLSDNPRIVYTVLGKEKLSDAEWMPVTDANKPQMRFFKVRVEVAK